MRPALGPTDPNPDELRLAVERATRLQGVTSALCEARTSEQVADIIITQVVAAMEADTGVIYLLSENGSECYPKSFGEAIPDAVRTREIVQDRSSLTVAIPMFWLDRDIGAIGLSFAEERTFDRDDCAFMRNMAQQCAVALERGRLYDAEQKARAAAEANETRFRRLIESNMIGVMFGDLVTVTGGNRKFLEMLKYTGEDLPAHTLTPPEFHHLDLRAQQQIREHGTFAPYEKEFICKDGGRVPVLIGGAAIQSSTDLDQVCFVLDLTERKRTEQALLESELRFRSIFDQAALGIVEADMTGHIVLPNRKYCDLLGYTQEEVIGKTFEQTTYHEDLVYCAEYTRQVFMGEIPGFSMDKRAICKDGSLIWVRITVSPVLGPDNRPVYALGIVEDIAERKRLQEQILVSQKLESLGVLAGGIAHDFNNLLTGIMGNASFALELAPPDPFIAVLRDILAASDRASHLTRQMLAYAGKGRFVTETFDLSKLTLDVASLIKAAIPKNVLVRIETAENLPPVKADLAQIQQLVMNLVINAAESIPAESAGSVRVTTRLEQLDRARIRSAFGDARIEPGPYLALCVEDSGCGMSEETKSRIFDPFFTTKFTGRGLGLAAVSGIVRGHKGAIHVSTHLGRGTTFTVFLPASVESAAARETPPLERDFRGGGTILVAEDEPIVRQMIQNTLEHYGYEVLLAEDGQQAVEIFSRSAADISLVLLDLTMPVMSGEKAAGLLKSIRPSVPVVLISGYDQSDVTRRFPGEATVFLQKPFTASELAHKVKSILGQ